MLQILQSSSGRQAGGTSNLSLFVLTIVALVVTQLASSAKLACEEASGDSKGSCQGTTQGANLLQTAHRSGVGKGGGGGEPSMGPGGPDPEPEPEGGFGGGGFGGGGFGGQTDTEASETEDTDAVEYVPGQPGGPWTLEQALIVKAKLYKMFSNGGGTSAYRELSDEDLGDFKDMDATGSVLNAPKVLRLGFHDCVLYSDGTGGCDGCLHWQGVGDRFSEDDKGALGVEQSRIDETHNNGLMVTILMLEKLYTDPSFVKGAPELTRSLKNSNISRADLWAFAAKSAVEFGIESNNAFCESDADLDALHDNIGERCQHGVGEEGCKVILEQPLEFKTGRRDCITDQDASYKAHSSKYENHPNAQGNGDSTLSFLKENYNMGVRESVAIMGSHTFGTMQAKHGLFRYGWTAMNDLMFNNHYFRNMVGKPDWFFEDVNCNKVGDAFGEKHAARWIPTIWLDTTVGGQVQWLQEKFVGLNCNKDEYKNDACCKDVPAGQLCHADNGRTSSSDPDDNVNDGCEKYRPISGNDETMLSSDIGLYLNFTIDADNAPGGCKNFENFNSANWLNNENRYTVTDGIWDDGGSLNRDAPECPLNEAADEGDIPLYQIIEEYADSNAAFISDYAVAFNHMASNGYASTELVDGPDTWTGVSCPFPEGRDDLVCSQA